MSATVDANVLLYASDAQSPRRARALEFLGELSEATELVCLFWPVIVAYLRIATHPGIFGEPLPPRRAMGNVADLLGRPHVRAPGELDGFWDVFDRTCSEDAVRGNLVSDAHVVALMRQHGVRTIWTSDRDFRRFDGISVRDPFA